MKKCIFIVGWSCFMAFNANADLGPSGGITLDGLGGDAVVCRSGDQKIISAELLDLYEGRVNRGIPHVYEAGSDKDYIHALFQRLTQLDETWGDNSLPRGDKLSDGISTYLRAGQASGPDFLYTVDSLRGQPSYSDLSLNPGCQIEKVLIVQAPQVPGDPTYIVQSDILKRLSADSVRSLILQFDLLRSFSDVNNRNGAGGFLQDTRYLLQQLTERKIADLTFPDYIHEMLPFTYWFDANGANGASVDFKYLPNNEVLVVEDDGDSCVYDNNARLDSKTTPIYGAANAQVDMEVSGHHLCYETIDLTGTIQISSASGDRTLSFADFCVDSNYFTISSASLGSGEGIVKLAVDAKKPGPWGGIFDPAYTLNISVRGVPVFKDLKVGDAGYSGTQKINVFQEHNSAFNQQCLWGVR
jgi:hypothetical protein